MSTQNVIFKNSSGDYLLPYTDSYKYVKLTMDTPSSLFLNTTVLYLGETDSNYIKGHIYTCVGSSGAYSWQDVTPGLAPESFDLVSDGLLARWKLEDDILDSSSSPVTTSQGYVGGTTWTARTLAGTGVTSLAYANNTFLAKASDGYSYYSTDGITWTKGVALSGNIYSTSNGFYCILADGYYQTSTDGITWNASEKIALAEALNGFKYFDNFYYLLYSDCYAGTCIKRTSDLATLSDVTSCPLTSCYDMHYNGSIYVAIGVGEYPVVYSYDGLTWTGVNYSFSLATTSYIRYYNNIFFITRGTSLYYSINGTTWNSINFSGIYDVAYGNGIYVIVNGTLVKYSSDLVTWTDANTSGLPTSSIRTVDFGGGYFLLGGSASLGNVLSYSSNGQNWSGLGYQFTYTDATSIQLSSVSKLRYIPSLSKWAVDGLGVNSNLSSTGWDKATYGVSFWANKNEQLISSTLLTCINYYGTVYENFVVTGRVAGATSNYDILFLTENKVFQVLDSISNINPLLIAKDRISGETKYFSGFTKDFYNSPFLDEANDKIFFGYADNSSSSIFYISSDGGNSWTSNFSIPKAIMSNKKWKFYYFLETYFLLTDSTTYYTSSDLVTWTAQTAPQSFKELAFDGNIFTAVAATGVAATCVYTSTDGLTWTARTGLVTQTWNKIVFSVELGLFVASSSYSSGNNIMTSPSSVCFPFNAEKSKKVAYFNGTSFLTFTPTNFPAGASAMTMGGWFNTPQGLTETLLAYGTSSTYRAMSFASNALCTYYYTTAQNNSYYNVGNIWTHWVITYDGLNLRLYINSEFVLAVKAPTTWATVCTLGCIGASIANASKFTGYMSDIRVYNRPLKTSEIKKWYDGLG